MRLQNARVYDPDHGFLIRCVCIEGGRIVEDCPDEAQDSNLEGCYIIPGLTDLHFHGCVGEDFSDGNPTGLQKMADYELSRGITQICPAGMTLSEEILTEVCKNAAAHRKRHAGGAWLAGINLEGPFLSRAKKGAQNEAYLRDPDISMLRRLQTASDGLVRLVTVAPEQPGALEFIQTVHTEEKDITVSLGHTAADYATASAAFDAGARQATHLFNAMPPFHHRDPGVVGAAFDHENVMVELICDGIHVHPGVVRAVFRLFGRDRVILISDSLRATGMPDGEYPFGGQRIEVHGPRATMLGDPNTLAGSVSDLMRCMVKAVEFGISLEDAVTAAALNPAKALGIDHEVGCVQAGKWANLAVLNPDLSLRTVIFQGKVAAGIL